MKTMLNSVKHVSITTDIWTSDSNVAYITVTCHFINKNTLLTRVLNTQKIAEAHTGVNIAAAMSKILDDWNIKEKVVTIVSDSAANMKNAVNEQLKKYHHPCVARTLNLSVNESLNKMKQL